MAPTKPALALGLRLLSKSEYFLIVDICPLSLIGPQTSNGSPVYDGGKGGR